ncbi:MAG: helix-turn-helix transcriptional regulator, partial [Clostridia bacterium]
ITQKEVSVKAHISTATLTKMRNNETVSLDVLDRIRVILDCDFGDLITAVPQPNSIEVDWKNESAIAQANGVYRTALKNYMHRNELTAANISEASSLALNTVKDFLKGKDLSSRSVLKLMRLGEQYNLCVNKILCYNQNCKKVYYAHSCVRSKTCIGYRTQY